MSVLLLSLTALLCCVFPVRAQPGGDVCTSGDLRLVQTPTITALNAGRVELCMRRFEDGVLVWGTIATSSFTDYWGDKNGHVACRQLLFDGFLNVILTDTIPVVDRAPQETSIHIDNVVCDGTEANLTSCSYNTVGATGHDDVFSNVYIVCRPRILYSELHTGGPNEGDIRLVGDTQNGAGIVEIYSSLFQWSTICPDEAWIGSNLHANIMCNQLGYESGVANTYSSSPASVSPRLLYNTDCSGSAEDIVRITLRRCSYLPSSAQACPIPSPSFAAIQCFSRAEVGDLRLVGGPRDREGIVEIFLNGRWGVICSGSAWGNPTNPRTVCNHLGFESERTVSVDTSSYLASESSLRPLWLGRVICEEAESTIAGCSRGVPLGYTDCSSISSLAAVDCGDPPPLSAGQIAAIVVPVLLVVIITILLYVYVVRPKCQKKFGAGWENDCNWYKRWRAQVARERAAQERERRSRPAAAARTTTVTPAANPPAQAAPPSNPLPPRANLAALEAELNPEPQDPEFTKEAPPSYNEAVAAPRPANYPPPYPV